MIAAALVAVLAALALAPAAHAAVLTEEDAAEVANALAEATAEQGICYGWHIDVVDPTGVEDGLEAGSNFGPGEPLDRARSECRGRFAELIGDVVYTSETSEAEDRAEWTVQSNLDDPPVIEDVVALGYDADDLLGDDNDLAIINAVGALPQIAADRRNAKPVAFVPERREPGTGGKPTGSPGSDLIRERGSLIGLCALMTLGGLAWLWRLRTEDVRRRRRPTRTPKTGP